MGGSPSEVWAFGRRDDMATTSPVVAWVGFLGISSVFLGFPGCFLGVS